MKSRESGGLGSKYTDKVWPVNLVLLDLPENSQIHNITGVVF